MAEAKIMSFRVPEQKRQIMLSNAGKTVAVNRSRLFSDKLDDLLFLMWKKNRLTVTVCFKLNCWLILLVFRFALGVLALIFA